MRTISPNISPDLRKNLTLIRLQLLIIRANQISRRLKEQAAAA